MICPRYRNCETYFRFAPLRVKHGKYVAITLCLHLGVNVIYTVSLVLHNRTLNTGFHEYTNSVREFLSLYFLSSNHAITSVSESSLATKEWTACLVYLIAMTYQ